MFDSGGMVCMPDDPVPMTPMRLFSKGTLWSHLEV